MLMSAMSKLGKATWDDAKSMWTGDYPERVIRGAR